MPYEYHAENHDWQYIVMAAQNLLMAGQALSKDKTLEFSCFTGSMLLSFCAIESFTNSIAFTLPRVEKYKNFSYEKYDAMNGFWDRIKCVCKTVTITANKSLEPFKTIKAMHEWRRSLVHTKPYRVETTNIQVPSQSTELHTEFREKEYVKLVNTENAKAFYATAYDFIELLKNASGLNPRAMCSYKVTE